MPSKKVGHANVDVGPQRLQMNARGIEREANGSPESSDVLHKQKHTFVILFPPVSVLVDVLLVPCPRITAQQLSEAQSGGGGGWRMSDVTEY